MNCQTQMIRSINQRVRVPVHECHQHSCYGFFFRHYSDCNLSQLFSCATSSSRMRIRNHPIWQVSAMKHRTPMVAVNDCCSNQLSMIQNHNKKIQFSHHFIRSFPSMGAMATNNTRLVPKPIFAMSRLSLISSLSTLSNSQSTDNTNKENNPHKISNDNANPTSSSSSSLSLVARTRNRGPVSWRTLFFVVVAATSAVSYFHIERERRLETMMGKIVSSELHGWTPRADYLAPRIFQQTKYGWFPREDGFGARECFSFCCFCGFFCFSFVDIALFVINFYFSHVIDA
jgi:hypothetical protein